MSDTTNKIKIKAILERVRYYKDESSWGIIDCSIDEVITGKPSTNPSGRICCKGIMPEPIPGKTYLLVGTEVEDKQYGRQYEISYMASLNSAELDNQIEQKKFLQTIFTAKQVENMYKVYENPYNIFLEAEYAKLVKIKGCGVANAEYWLRKFNENLYMAKIYIELEQYDLTVNMVKKLLDTFNSPELIIQRVQENPYILAELDGVGFITADKYAMNGGISPHSIARVKAFIMYYLTQMADQGYSYVHPDDLLEAIISTLGEDVPNLVIIDAIHSLSDILWWNEDKSKIGLKRLYNLEEKIAKELIRLRDAESHFEYDNWQEVVKSLEEQQGWQYSDEQIEAIKLVLKENLSVIHGKPGCVDCDTEFFTGTQWKRIADYQEEDKVLQYNEDGTAELVIPSDYIKQPTEHLWQFQTKYGLDMCLSDNHDVIYVTEKLPNTIRHTNILAIKEQQETTTGFYGKFITTFKYNPTGISLTDDQIRLCIAIFADGTFNYHLGKQCDTYNKVRIHIKKERKKIRLENLLQDLNLTYEKKPSTAQGYTDFYFYSPIGQCKNFPEEWYNMSSHQMEIIKEEVFNWDGSYGEQNRFCTKNKQDADFIQFVLTSLGNRATIIIQNRSGQPYTTCGKEYIRKSIEYSVNCTKSNSTLIGLTTGKQDVHTLINKYTTKDGYEYCFTVPSHMLVLRRNNKIFITGNCGKTTVVKAMTRILKNYTIAQAALSGKAAARMSEVTELESSTIHRLLGYPCRDENGKNGYTFHDENPINKDIVIIDEFSMLDGYLAYNLLRAIKSGTKVVLLGDRFQLDCIGVCNVAKDLIESPSIPTAYMSKIHRQALKSGIISECSKIIENVQITPRDWVGKETRGEIKDLLLDCYHDRNNSYFKTMQYMSDLLSKGIDISNIQVITPMKDKGGACTFTLNNAIQELYNPKDSSKNEIVINYGSSKTAILREGDKVINTKNNYNVFDINTNTKTNIFNGYLGFITEIKSNGEVVINFGDNGMVAMSKENLKHIELAYAITCHRGQGSQFDYVIVVMDFTAYNMLYKEWLNTALSRAIKQCILVAETGALQYCISQNKVDTKLTHLQHLLYELDNPVEKTFNW